MKQFILFLMVLGLVQTTNVRGQECSMDDSEKTKVGNYANTALIDLIECCAHFSAPGMEARQPRYEIFYGKDKYGRCATYKLNGTYYITMKASWKGGISGRKYWIKGVLTYNTKDKSRSWKKISDSGGFQQGCGDTCIE